MNWNFAALLLTRCNRFQTLPIVWVLTLLFSTIRINSNLDIAVELCQYSRSTWIQDYSGLQSSFVSKSYRPLCIQYSKLISKYCRYSHLEWLINAGNSIPTIAVFFQFYQQMIFEYYWWIKQNNIFRIIVFVEFNCISLLFIKIIKMCYWACGNSTKNFIYTKLPKSQFISMNNVWKVICKYRHDKIIIWRKNLLMNIE